MRKCHRSDLALYILFILCGLITTIKANAACNDGHVYGPDLSVTRNETDTGSIQDTAFMDLSGSIKCHGVITSWRFIWIVSGLSSCHNVIFQVWRPLGGSKYRLIGETHFSPNIFQCEPTSTGILSSPAVTTSPAGILTDATYTITSAATTTYQETTTTQQATPYIYPESEQIDINLIVSEYIPVQPGDMYGWTDPGAMTSQRRIPFESASSGSGQFSKVLILPSGSISGTIGDVTDWSTARTEVRNYSLNIVMAKRDPPYIISPDPSCSPGTCPALANLAENRAPGDFIYKLEAANHYNYNDVINPDLTYILTNDTCSAFDIDLVTGNIYTRASLDYEYLLTTLPPITHFVNCTLTAIAKEGSYDSLPVYLTVNVDDVNEPHVFNNLPNWTEPLNVTTISANDKVFDVTLSDPDDPVLWPNKTFTIICSMPPGAPFYITSVHPVTAESYGEIRASVDLTDWQGSSVFTLYVIVTDGEHTDGPSELLIQLTNIREKPIITNLPVAVSVPEQVIGPSSLFAVTAKAMPPSRADKIQFYISNIYPANVDPTVFQVNATTGEIMCSSGQHFDYFGINPYHIEVVARYSNGHRLESDPENLTVTIQWTNQEPYFNKTDDLDVEIEESQTLGSYLPGVVLTGHDRDLPIGDWIHYSLTGNGSHLFRPDNLTNRVYVISDLHLDAGVHHTVYKMGLWVIDSHGAHTDIGLSVKVTDVNNHRPTPDKTEYHGQVPGDSPAPIYTQVTIRTTDGDGPSNADLTYQIIDNDARLYFKVNTSGDVVTKQPVPYATYQVFLFTVFITDNGKPEAMNATVQVSIDIMTGDNAYAPVFFPVFDTLDLRTDTDKGSVIYTVYAYDNDTLNSVAYLPWTLSDYYSLNTASGQLSTKRTLMPYSNEILYINAMDAGLPHPYYAETPFTLRIDTYDPREVLVEIYLLVTLSDFTETQDEFLAAVNSFISYWDIRLEGTKLYKDSTIVKVYAIESALPDKPENQLMEKVFIRQDDLFDVLSKNPKGDPSDGLLGSDFAPWLPYKVQLYHPIWITDTPGGVALLSLLCILAVAGLIIMFVLLSKKYGWSCYKRPSRIGLTSNKIYPQEEAFSLRYVRGSRPSTVFTTNVPAYPVRFPSSKETLHAALADADGYSSCLPPVAIEDDNKPLPTVASGAAA